MPKVLSIATAVPGHVVSQEFLRQLARQHFGQGIDEIGRLISVFDNVDVRQRHLCVPVEWFQASHSFEERNALYNRFAEELSGQAIQASLEQVDVDPARIRHIVFVSTSGLSTPSLEARLIHRLGFDSHVRRTPVFGLGCAGGAAGLSRCFDLSRADPGHLILLVAVEISSLTFQPIDFSKSNLVASALFADGAAAVLVGGDAVEMEGPAIRGTHSTIWPDTLDVMGWDFSSLGFSVVFSRSIPFLLQKYVKENVEEFLVEYGQTIQGLSHYAVHPGGAKILDAMATSLNLTQDKLALSRSVLQEYGNMSSPTMLFVLKKLLESGLPRPGELGLAAAFGPGFSSELLLLEW